MNERDETERLFQQLSGNTPKEDLDHLKVFIQGDKERGDEILDYLKSLDLRVNNNSCWLCNDSNTYYYIDIFNHFCINISRDSNDLKGYTELDIDDILDDIEEEIGYCPMCDKVLDEFNELMHYSDGEECCELCYDEDLDEEEDDEDDYIEFNNQSSETELERSENMLRQLSEIKSTPIDIIDTKLSELNKISKRRR